MAMMGHLSLARVRSRRMLGSRSRSLTAKRSSLDARNESDVGTGGFSGFGRHARASLSCI